MTEEDEEKIIEQEDFWNTSYQFCRNPKCNKEIINGDLRFTEARRARKPMLRNYCSNKCYDKHLEEIRSGAPARIKAFLERKKNAI